MIDLYKKFLISFFLVSFMTLSCGKVTLGPSFPRDPRPATKMLAQGQLIGQNGQTASGTALVFSDGTSTGYIARIEGLSIKSNTGLLVQVYGSGGLLASFSLRSFVGNQNYYFTNSTSGITFNDIYLYSAPENINYAAAQLY